MAFLNLHTEMQIEGVVTSGVDLHFWKKTKNVVFGEKARK